MKIIINNKVAFIAKKENNKDKFCYNYQKKNKTHCTHSNIQYAQGRSVTNFKDILQDTKPNQESKDMR